MRFLRPDDVPPAWIIDRLREPPAPDREPLRPEIPAQEPAAEPSRDSSEAGERDDAHRVVIIDI